MKQKIVEKKWHLVDADGKILGRMATEVANILMGKSKPEYKRNNNIGDFVVVINSSKIKVTGNKEELKRYIHHTGYPQGFREIVLKDLRIKNPNEIIIHAVKGMLPQNKLRSIMLKRLYIFADNKHPFEKKIINNN